MNWIFDNFQILLIVALAFASWLKHRHDTKAAEREEQQAREEMSAPPDWSETEVEWQRPEPEYRPLVPPPLVKKAADAPPPVPQMTQTGTSELQRQEDIQQRLRQLRETRESTARQAREARQARQAREARHARQAREARMTGPSEGGTRGMLRKLLRADRDKVRRAIILREILGPPVGLRKPASDSPMVGS